MTNGHVRARFEQSFGLHWPGWTGRYFHSLDTMKKPELQRWIIRDYEREQHQAWHFKKVGIVLVNTADEVVILEIKAQLSDALPKILTTTACIERYDLPKRMDYPFWFDITLADTAVNKVMANFSIDVNEAGKEALAARGMPTSFPAVQYYRQQDYTFFYFCADCSDTRSTCYPHASGQ